MRQPLAVVAAVLLLMSVTAGLRADVVPQDASDLVTLEGRFIQTAAECGGTIGNAFAIDRRTFADGSVSSTPFVIPARRNGIVFTSIVPVGVSGNSVPLSGIAMAPGTTPCFSKSGPWIFGEATLHGFLVRDPN